MSDVDMFLLTVKGRGVVVKAVWKGWGGTCVYATQPLSLLLLADGIEHQGLAFQTLDQGQVLVVLAHADFVEGEVLGPDEPS